MQVEIQTKVLASALKRLARVIPSGATSMQVLSNVLIRAYQNGTLDLVGSNNEVTEKLSISSEQVFEPGALLVSFSYLNGLMTKIKAPKIEMHTEPAHGLLKISAGKNAQYEVSYLSEEEYPNVLTKVEPKTSFYVFSDDLKSLIESVLHAAAVKDPRPVLQGICLKSEGKKLYACATDSHRLAKGAITVETDEAFDLNIIIPASECKPLLDFPIGVDVKVSSDQNKIEFEEDHTKLVIRAIDGQYPNLSNITSYTSVSEIVVAVDELYGSIERSMLVDDETAVIMQVYQGEMRVSRKGQRAGSHEKIQVEGDGTWTLGMNPRYVLDTLRAIQTPKVRLVYQGDGQPLIMLNEHNGETTLYMIVPVRIDTETKAA